jgi:hypothetical protein
MTFGFLKLLSLGFSTFLQVVILCLCFYFNEKALNKVGLTDEYMSNELEKIENKKRGK